MDSRYLKLGVAAVTVSAVLVVVVKRKEEMDARKRARAANKTSNQSGEKQ